jgi:hypothetical protein
MGTRAFAVVVVMVGFGLAGCGGDEKPSQDDFSTVTAMLTSGAAVQSAMQPLMLCLPEQPACYRRSGPAAVRAVQREKNRFAPLVAATDNPCLADVGRIFSQDLDAYADAGRAATRGKPSAFDKAISRSTRLEIAMYRKLDECGFSQGRTAEIAAGIREVNIAMLRLSEEIIACRERPCVVRVARKMERKAREGVAGLNAYLGRLPEDAPHCLREGILQIRTAYRTFQGMTVALQKGEAAKAEKEGKRSNAQQIRAMRHMAACIESMR